MKGGIVRMTLVLLAVTAGGCKKKAVPVAPVPLAPTTASSTENADALRAAREKALRDSLDKARADSLARLASDAEMARMRGELEAPVLFEYDAAEMTDAGRAVLDAKLPILRANTGLRIRISGHTDARGSDEYNLALGLRRAAATRKYLVDRGIAPARVDIVSFGEERPAEGGDSDGAFAKNRRAEFEILAGGSSLRVPPR
jgi:peptidoglycan-associated lipoprotein